MRFGLSVAGYVRNELILSCYFQIITMGMGCAHLLPFLILKSRFSATHLVFLNAVQGDMYDI